MEPHESFAGKLELAKRAWRGKGEGPREKPIPERLKKIAEEELSLPEPEEVAEKIPGLEEDYRKFERLLELERRKREKGFGYNALNSLMRSWNGIYTNRAKFFGLLLGLGLFWPLLAFGFRGFMEPHQAMSLLRFLGVLGGLFVGSILVIIGLAYARGWSPEASPKEEIKPRVDLGRLKELAAPEEVAEEISEKPAEISGTESVMKAIEKFRGEPGGVRT